MRRRCLAVRGKRAILAQPLVAIVGSRNASAAGVKFAERLARELGDAGFGIVSGLARGIDAAAHRASLATGTIAVLAGGHERIYPAEHVDLLDKHPRRRRRGVGNAARLGAARARLPAPQPADLGALGRRRHRRGGAPLRLADHGAAGRRAGPRSVRGARLAARPARRRHQRPAQAGRDLGHRSRRRDRGAGADPRPRPRPAGARSRTHEAPLPLDSEPAEDERSRIIALLGPTPTAIDDLVRLSRTSPAIVRTVLLELEIAGRLERHGGALVSLL